MAQEVTERDMTPREWYYYCRRMQDQDKQKIRSGEKSSPLPQMVNEFGDMETPHCLYNGEPVFWSSFYVTQIQMINCRIDRVENFARVGLVLAVLAVILAVAL